jgi:hypothetical protein
MAAVVNLTPHEVVILDAADRPLVRLPSQGSARRADRVGGGQ